MDYKKLSPKELAEAYLKASNFTKRRILRSGIDLNSLMGELSGHQLVELAEIHPYKEMLCDTLLDNLKNFKNPTKPDKSSLYDVSKYENLYSIAVGIEKTKKVGFFGRIMDSLRGRDTKLIEGTIDKKIAELRKGASLMYASQEMASYWQRDLVDSQGKSRDTRLEEDKAMEYIMELKYRTMYNEAIDKYHAPHRQQYQETFAQAYTGLVPEDKKDLAEVLGTAEFMGRHDGDNISYSTDEIAGVKKLDNFQIGGHNLGEVFVIEYADKSNGSIVENKSEVYRRNEETGLMEKIGRQQIQGGVSQYILDVDVGEGRLKRLNEQSSEVSYDEKGSITAREVHEKALLEEVKKGLKQDVEIGEMTEVQLGSITGMLVKTQDRYGVTAYQMVTFEDKYPRKGEMTVSRAKEEMFRTIELPTVHSDGEHTTRDTAKVAATVTIEGEELQIYTDKHGNTRVAEIFDGKNKAYPNLTRTRFKDTRQREMARPDKDDTRQRSLQLMPEKKNSQNIAQVVPKDMDDDREM